MNCTSIFRNNRIPSCHPLHVPIVLNQKFMYTGMHASCTPEFPPIYYHYLCAHTWKYITMTKKDVHFMCTRWMELHYLQVKQRNLVPIRYCSLFIIGLCLSLHRGNAFQCFLQSNNYLLLFLVA